MRHDGSLIDVSEANQSTAASEFPPLSKFISPSKTAPVAAAPPVSLRARRSTRLLSSLAANDGAEPAKGNNKKKGPNAPADEVKEEAPVPRKRGRPRKSVEAASVEAAAVAAAAPVPESGKRPKRGAAAAATAAAALGAVSSLEEAAAGLSPSPGPKRRQRRTSKDSDVSDAPSDATAALLVEAEEDGLAPPSLDPSWERRLEDKGQAQFVFGIDEAGRGPLAGPVVAAACYIPSHVVVPGIQVKSARIEEKGGPR